MKKNDGHILGTVFSSPQNDHSEHIAHRRVENWCERQQKNKPQSNSVAGGGFIFKLLWISSAFSIIAWYLLKLNLLPVGVFLMLVSGLHIGWSIGSPNLRLQIWFENVPDGEIILALSSWFIGAIIGSFISLFILPMWEKKTIYVGISI